MDESVESFLAKDPVFQVMELLNVCVVPSNEKLGNTADPMGQSLQDKYNSDCEFILNNESSEENQLERLNLILESEKCLRSEAEEKLGKLVEFTEAVHREYGQLLRNLIGNGPKIYSSTDNGECVLNICSVVGEQVAVQKLLDQLVVLSNYFENSLNNLDASLQVLRNVNGFFGNEMSCNLKHSAPNQFAVLENEHIFQNWAQISSESSDAQPPEQPNSQQPPPLPNVQAISSPISDSITNSSRPPSILENLLKGSNPIVHAEDKSRSGDKYGVYSCICGFPFPTEKSLKYHIKYYTPSPPGMFKCDFCQKRFTKRMYLNKHIQKLHGSKNMGKQIDDAKQQHGIDIASSRMTKYKCLCGKMYLNKDSLIYHVQVKTKGRVHKCNMCSASFYHRYNLIRHQKSVHKT